MAWICAVKNEFCAVGYEFLVESGKVDVIEGSHCPLTATQFSTRKEAKQWAEENISQYNSSDITFWKHDTFTAEWNEYVKSGYMYRYLPRKNPSVSKKCDTDDPIEILKWWAYLGKNGDREVSYDDYKTWPQLYSVFKHLWGFNRYHDISDYSQKTVHGEMCVAPDSDYEVFVRELRMMDELLDFFEYDDRKVKAIDIFDHYLSEYGNSCTFYYNFDEDYFAIEGYDEKRGTLREVFEFWKKYRYYD